MANDRLGVLRNMLEQNPADSRLRYMLAMELAASDDLEAAIREYEALIAADPGYAYAYFHAGQALVKLRKTDEARRMYVQGIEAALRTGNEKARKELQGALEMLGP
jgi:tetratricopeptide (TPR) repeat protein